MRWGCVGVIAMVMAAAPIPAPAGASPGAAAPLVVVDPGHGGTNVGAPGVGDRVYEKRVTLALGRELARDLRGRGLRVVLTRERDTYLTLRQRVHRANELGADAFVSLHANATADHDERGYETFVLTPEALDVDARALRLGDGRPRPGVPEDVAAILDDVERGAALPAAARLAGAIQAALRRVRGPDGDRGVRQAAFDVLMGAAMPAVLVEVGFLDHPIEGLELLDPAIRSDLCDAIAGAVAGPRGVGR